MGTVGEKCTVRTRWRAYKDFNSIPPVKWRPTKFHAFPCTRIFNFIDSPLNLVNELRYFLAKKKYFINYALLNSPALQQVSHPVSAFSS